VTPPLCASSVVESSTANKYSASFGSLQPLLTSAQQA
jgi:hypothetical protein